MKYLVTFFLFTLSLPVSSNSIVWEVDNPFRLIDYNVSKSDYKINQGQSSYEFVIERMASKNRDKLPPFDETHWNTDTDSSRRLSEDYIFPKEIAVNARLNNSHEGYCIWKYKEQSEKIQCSEKFTFYAKTQFGEGDPTLTVEILSSGENIHSIVVVQDRLILGLGDSFASGEGNPDMPTKISQSGIKSLAKDNSNINTTGRWMVDAEGYWIEENARWFDTQCHRSLFSQHVLASLRLASENSHESVTLVPLACSGAEVLDGLLIPQKNPPGGGERVYDSQINVAVQHLCRNGNLRKVRKAFYRGYTGNNLRKQELQDVYRCDGELRVPDAVFLSIGGNDVGFSSSIAWATIPNGYRNPAGYFAVNLTHKVTDPVCPKYTGQKICSYNQPVGKDRVKYWLPDYYKWLSEQLTESGLVVDEGNVYLTAYPNPTYTEDGITLCDKDRTTDLNEQVRSKLLKAFRTQRWDLGITKYEMLDLNRGLITPLYKEMKRSATLHGWTFVDSHIGDLLKHGICAGFQREHKGVPIYPHIRKGKWYPEPPSESWAYDVTKKRWFRSTNDSMLFQNDQTDSDMNGAFHPDFRAHAVIADHLYKTVNSQWTEKEVVVLSETALKSN